MGQMLFQLTVQDAEPTLLKEPLNPSCAELVLVTVLVPPGNVKCDKGVHDAQAVGDLIQIRIFEDSPPVLGPHRRWAIVQPKYVPKKCVLRAKHIDQRASFPTNFFVQ